MEETEKYEARIMIVDDTPQNLRLLENMLSSRGYKVYALPNGEMALNAVKKNPPDLILLDINMPGMNGYEVCRRLKENPASANIPVIFLSAMHDIAEKMDGFAAGGVDYITKPFQFEEVSARAAAHLKIHFLQKALEESNKTLEEKIALRTKQLANVNECLMGLDKIKSDFLSMICHEMRTPVNGILGLAEIAFDMCGDTPECEQLKMIYTQSKRRMEELLDDAQILGILDTLNIECNLTNVHLCEFVHKIIEKCNFKDNITCGLDGDMAIIHCSELVERALTTLIRLAECFTKTNGVINGQIFVENNSVVMRLELDNLAISPQDAAGFFDINSLARASSVAENMGISPVVAQRIITLLGGDSRLECGSNNEGILEVRLPYAKAAQ